MSVGGHGSDSVTAAVSIHDCGRESRLELCHGRSQGVEKLGVGHGHGHGHRPVSS